MADGTPITNSGATTDPLNNYEICMRSGFRFKPGTLTREEYTGLWVHPDYAEGRHPQTLVRSKPEHHKGPKHGEGEDSFISTAVTVGDL